MPASDRTSRTRSAWRDRPCLGTDDVASGLVAAAVNAQDGDQESSLELLEVLIELTRVDGENRGHLGERFMEEAAISIEGLVLLDGIEPAVTHGLTMAYAGAGVEAPAALLQQLTRQFGLLRVSGRLSDNVPNVLKGQINSHTAPTTIRVSSEVVARSGNGENSGCWCPLMPPMVATTCRQPGACG